MGFEIEILQRKLPLYVPEKSIQTGAEWTQKTCKHKGTQGTRACRKERM